MRDQRSGATLAAPVLSLGLLCEFSRSRHEVLVCPGQIAGEHPLSNELPKLGEAPDVFFGRLDFSEFHNLKRQTLSHKLGLFERVGKREAVLRGHVGSM